MYSSIFWRKRQGGNLKICPHLNHFLTDFAVNAKSCVNRKTPSLLNRILLLAFSFLEDGLIQEDVIFIFHKKGGVAVYFPAYSCLGFLPGNIGKIVQLGKFFGQYAFWLFFLVDPAAVAGIRKPLQV